MSIVTIRATITKALAAWADSKGLPLSREMQPFTKPANYAPFLELNIIPANTILASIDGQRKRYLGTVIVNIWTKEGQGMGTAEKLAEEIAGLFTVVPKTLMPVSVETVPSIKRPVLDGSGYVVTGVSFGYRLEV